MLALSKTRRSRSARERQKVMRSRARAPVSARSSSLASSDRGFEKRTAEVYLLKNLAGRLHNKNLPLACHFAGYFIVHLIEWDVIPIFSPLLTQKL
jgi:hypothetical protein